MSAKIGQFKIAFEKTVGGKKETQRLDCEGEIVGDFAIHEPVDMRVFDGVEFVVTHIHTGFFVAGTRLKRTARGIAKTLQPLFDWNSDDKATILDRSKPHMDVINNLRARGLAETKPIWDE